MTVISSPHLAQYMVFLSVSCSAIGHGPLKEKRKKLAIGHGEDSRLAYEQQSGLGFAISGASKPQHPLPKSVIHLSESILLRWMENKARRRAAGRARDGLHGARARAARRCGWAGNRHERGEGMRTPKWNRECLSG